MFDESSVIKFTFRILLKMLWHTNIRIFQHGEIAITPPKIKKKNKKERKMRQQASEFQFQ